MARLSRLSGGYCARRDDSDWHVACITEVGEIKRVPTWHEHDYGVELVGAPVVLTQPFVRGTSGCVLVEAVVNTDPEAKVFIAIDQDGDGTPEWQRELSGEGFESKSWEVDVDVFGDNIITLDPDPVERWPGIASVRKTTPGKTIIARLRISKECLEDEADRDLILR